MSRPVKIVLYIACITVAVVFGLRAKEQFRRAGVAKQERQLKLDDAANIENTNVVVETTNVSAESTNAAAITDTNELTTNVTAAATINSPAAKKVAAAHMSYSALISNVL